LFPLAGIAVPQEAETPQVGFGGTWRGAITLPFDPEPSDVRLALEEGEEGAWSGALDTDFGGPGLATGFLKDGALNLQCDLGSGPNPLRVVPDEDTPGGMKGHLFYRGFPITIRLEREREDWAPELRLELELPEERPVTVHHEGLPDFWLEEMVPLVEARLTESRAVGLALAVVVDGELLDARAWGWSDLREGRPVAEGTLFRWASISKSVTGVAATKLALAGDLDLDADVRELVPEFPEKEHVVTTRLLLGHLAGMPHYQHMPRVTRVEGDVDFPFRDPVRAIDMFKAAPLVHAPGSAYSYSTHGYALVGAVLERCSERGFAGEVGRLVSVPLGMESFEPDDPAEPRAARTVGYRVTADGRVFESGDTDISWKLAGGGFQSTVSDLARFAAGLFDEEYFGEAERELAWTSMETGEGEETGYGFGFGVSVREGRRVVSHSGGQRRTSTFLLCFPDERIAIALMCNTEGTSLGDLAHELAEVLFDEG